MADPAQGPDLHTIFGMDEERKSAEPTIEIAREHVSGDDAGSENDGAAAGGVSAGANGRAGASADADGALAEITLDPALGDAGDEDDGGVAREDRRASAGGSAKGAGRRGEGQWTGITRATRRGSSARFLTDVIVDLGFATDEQVKDAIETSRTMGTTPEKVLLSSGALSSDQLARALAERYGLDHLDLSVFQVDMAAANWITTAAAKRYQAVPVAFVDERTLLVAMADPSNVLAVDDIAIMTGHEVRVAVAAPDDVAAMIAKLNRLEDSVGEETVEEEERAAELVDLGDASEDAPVIKLVNQIVAQAVELGASDVHLSPHEHELRVRFRIDGVLQDMTTVPRKTAAGMISRVKIMAELDIAEKRLPQDGRVGLTVDGRRIDLRAVTLPSVHGEAIVLRVLDKDGSVVRLEDLGLGPVERERFEHAFHQAHGAVLVTGPTGSGKSTTLYAALQVLNTPERNILTVEDPVEYQMEGLTQLQVSNKRGLTFASGLRSMMRADPDVIMVGEIRDKETAQIAVESALTGHLVLSTLHTNDAPSAITRLIEMGIEPFLVASAIDCVVAQRLARLLCSTCKRRMIVTTDVLHANGFKALVDLEGYEPVGCRRCNGSGYRGRLGLYELMMVTPEVQTMVLERRSAEEIRDVAVRQGMRRLRDDGLEKAREGLTSVAEVLRVVGSS
jgi:type IV pilus assembly protein PilB